MKGRGQRLFSCCCCCLSASLLGLSAEAGVRLRRRLRLRLRLRWCSIPVFMSNRLSIPGHISHQEKLDGSASYKRADNVHKENKKKRTILKKIKD